MTTFKATGVDHALMEMVFEQLGSAGTFARLSMTIDEHMCTLLGSAPHQNLLNAIAHIDAGLCAAIAEWEQLHGEFVSPEILATGEHMDTTPLQAT